MRELYVCGNLKSIFIAFVFSFWVLCSFGSEQIVFEQLTTSDGLSSGTINSIFKDSRGFMWFSTDDGLNRYDGFSFKVFNAHNPDWNIEKSLQFLDIIEDPFGTIWIATSQGLYFFDRHQEKIIHFLTYTNIILPDKLLNEIINVIFFDSRDYLWVGTYNGLVRIKISNDISLVNNEHITLFRKSPDSTYSINNNIIYSINEDHDQNIWIAVNSDVLECYNYENDKLTQHVIDVPNLKYWDYLSKRIYIDNDNNFWINTQGVGFIFWDKKQNVFTQYKTLIVNGKEINTTIVRCLLIDSNNRVWIGTDGNGLIIYDKKNEVFSGYSKDANDHSKLSSNAIYSLYEDDESNFWIGTYLAGVNKLVSNRLNFGAHYSIPNSTNKLSHKIVTNFCEDKNGLIWISTDGGGINTYDRKTGKFRHFKNDPNNKNSLSIDAAITLLCDSENKIWIGTYNGGLNIYDQEKEKFDHYRFNPNDSNSISSDHVWGFAQDKWGNMWVATASRGLNLMKKGSSSFVRYQLSDIDYSGPDQISSNAITYLFIDKNNRLWIATEWGLDMLHLDEIDFSQPIPNLAFNHFLNPNIDAEVKEYRISYVTQDHLGNIWVGTKGAGLVKLDLETSKHTYFSVDDGLPHNIISGILFDDKNNLWISTNKGLSNFDISSGQFKNYDTSYGLQSDFFMKTACMKTADGMMFFGGINGFNEFDPKNISSEIKHYKPVITDLKLFNQSVSIGTSYNGRVILEKSINETNNIELKYNENNITFEFSALDFANPEKNIYMFILEGFDENWQMTDANMRIAKYTNLDPGTYTFKVKASNNDESWSEISTNLHIYIKPPWWETRMFVTLAVLLMLSALFLFYYMRVNALHKQKLFLVKTVNEKTKQLKKTNHDLKEAVQTKDKFLSIVAHDLLNPFNSILGFSNLLLENYENFDDQRRVEMLKTINKSSNELYELLGNLLQWSRSERGLMKFTPERLEIQEQILKVLSVVELLANSKQIQIDTIFPKKRVYVDGDFQQLSIIFRNLISNALKFTNKGGKITVKVIEKVNFVEVSIIDNGVGMPESVINELFKIESNITTTGTNNEKGTGLGLLLVKECVEKHGGVLTVKSAVGKGSSFSFTIPLWTKD